LRRIALTVLLYFRALHILGAELDIHSMLVRLLRALLGMQLCCSHCSPRVSAQNAGLLPRGRAWTGLLKTLTLDLGLLLGLLAAISGLVWSAAAFWQCAKPASAHWTRGVVMRDTIPAAALMVGAWRSCSPRSC